MLPETDLTIIEKFLLFLADTPDNNILSKLNPILAYLIQPNFPSWVNILKVVSVAIILFFIWLIYRGIFQSSFFNRIYVLKYQDLVHSGGEKKKTPGKRRWNTIKQRLETGREPEFKLAILEADSLLEETLTKMGYKEETIEGNIKKVGSNVLSNIDTLITIRQIRSNIVSDPDYKINLDEAKKTISVYEKVFSELNLI